MSVEDTDLVVAQPLSVEALQHARLLANPYVSDAPRRRVAKMTPALKRKFCEALANGASPTKVAKAIGIARSTAYYQRGVDPEFWEAWDEALERAADLHEDALNELSVKTRNVGAVIFQLKNRRPEKWQDRHDVNVEKHEEHRYVHELDADAARAIAQNILAQVQQQEPPVSLPAVPVSVEENS